MAQMFARQKRQFFHPNAGRVDSTNSKTQHINILLFLIIENFAKDTVMTDIAQVQEIDK